MRLPNPKLISSRVTFWVSLVVVALAAIHLYTMRPERRFFEQKMRESERVALIIESHLLAEMTAGEPDNIQRHLELLPGKAGIRRVEVFDPTMSVHFSSEPARVGRKLDPLNESPCMHCHGQRVRPARVVYGDEKLGRVFAVDHVLTNEVECRPCHEDAGPILGNILVEVSFTEHDLEALTARRRLTVMAGVLLVVMLIGMAAIIHRLVGRPAAVLMEKMRRVERGDFSIGNPRVAQDEFGSLERGFHGMVDRLRELYTEMETKIQERTRSLSETQAQVMHQEKLAGIGQLAAGVAHEIGNPLTAIDSLVQLLAVESDDPNVREKTGIIQQQVDRISEIVHGMADLSRPLSLEWELVDVNSVLQSVLSLLKYDARLQNIEIRSEFSADLAPVRCVEDRLFGVLLNLALNAADAMPGGGTLTIGTSRSGGDVVITVADTGCGIAPENLPKVFDAYFTTKAPGKGTGLGLSVCRAFFEGVGGAIEADSVVGRGSAFRARLPVERMKGGGR